MKLSFDFDSVTTIWLSTIQEDCRRGIGLMATPFPIAIGTVHGYNLIVIV
jgi:hypothetical protein